VLTIWEGSGNKCLARKKHTFGLGQMHYPYYVMNRFGREPDLLSK